jgi:lipoate-protein ligase B
MAGAILWEGYACRVDELLVCHLGAIDYRAAVALQESLRERVRAGELPGIMLLLEHPPTYTLGRRTKADALPLGEEWARGQGIDVVKTDRGGQLTYHGPGQLVGYPILAVDDVVGYLRTIERGLIAALADEGVEAHRREGIAYTGVWVQDRKIASIGVHVSRGLTTHGFALNVDNDLAPFTWAVACGLPDVAMTSLAVETGREGRMACVRKAAAFRVCEALGRRQRLVAPARLGLDAPVLAPA